MLARYQHVQVISNGLSARARVQCGKLKSFLLVRMLLMHLSCRLCSGSWPARAVSSPSVTALWIVSRHEACSPRLVPVPACRCPLGMRYQRRPAFLPWRPEQHRLHLFKADRFHARNPWPVQKVPRKWLDGARLAAHGCAMEIPGVQPLHG